MKHHTSMEAMTALHIPARPLQKQGDTTRQAREKGLCTRGHEVRGVNGARHAERPAAAARRLVFDRAVCGGAPPVHRCRQAVRMRKRLVRHLEVMSQLTLCFSA